MAAAGRITTNDWDAYDTRHAVFQPARMSADELERGYWRAYRSFYRWRSIAHGAAAHGAPMPALRHAAYAAGWKKFEPLWDLLIRARRTALMLPMLETILSEFGRRSSASVDDAARNRNRRRPHPIDRPGIPMVAASQAEPRTGCSTTNPLQGLAWRPHPGGTRASR
jgi:hypothetical protein